MKDRIKLTDEENKQIVEKIKELANRDCGCKIGDGGCSLEDIQPELKEILGERDNG